MSENFDPYYKWLGIPPKEQPANYYRLLGIVLYESDTDVIESAADRQMAHIRTFQSGRYSAQSQDVLNALSAAKVCLLKPAQKAEYDRELREKLKPEPKPLPVTASADPRPPQALAASSVAPSREISQTYSVQQTAPVANQPRPTVQGGASSSVQIQTRSAASHRARPQRKSAQLPIIAGLAALLLVVAGWLVWTRSNRVDQQQETEQRIAEKSNTKVGPTKVDSTAPKVAEKSAPSSRQVTTPPTVEMKPPVQPQPQPTSPPAKVAVNVSLVLPSANQAIAEPARPPVVPESPSPVVSVPTGNAPPPAIVPFDGAQAKAHQAAWSKHIGTPVETPNLIGMKMVLIPPGEFLMGSSDEQLAAVIQWPEYKITASEQDRIRSYEQPQHRVVLTLPYLIGATEVTIGQFRQFVEAKSYVSDGERTKSQNPRTANKYTWREPQWPIADDLPVNYVSYSDCFAFCNWLSEQEKRTVCYRLEGNQWQNVFGSGYRLPTEAEWEYACRAGTAGHFGCGDDVAELRKYAWLLGNGSVKVNAVGAKAPNAFGLYDMHGNLLESCQGYFANYDEKDSPHDPQGTISGTYRISRGGGFNYSAYNCRSAARFRMPGVPHSNNGFRVARGIDSDTRVTNVAPNSTPQVASVPPKQPVGGAVAAPLAPLPGPGDGTVDLQALQWILSVGGFASIRMPDGLLKSINKAESIPNSPFFLETFVLQNQPTLTRAGVTNLRGLKHIKSATLSNGTITDDGLQQVESLKSLESLNLAASLISKAGLVHLKDLPNLTTLNLYRAKITDDDLTLLQSFRMLKDLDVSSCKLTDEGLTHLAGLPKLESLTIRNVPITDVGLEWLSAAPRLQRLYLDGTKITSAGLQSLQRLGKLELLHLRDTAVNDAGLRYVGECPNLTTLHLMSCPITDVGLEHLKKCSKLTEISVQDTQISDAGLEHLKSIGALRIIFAARSKITKEGAAKLKAVLPKCDIRGAGL